MKGLRDQVQDNAHQCRLLLGRVEGLEEPIKMLEQPQQPPEVL